MAEVQTCECTLEQRRSLLEVQGCSSMCARNCPPLPVPSYNKIKETSHINHLLVNLIDQYVTSLLLRAPVYQSPSHILTPLHHAYSSTLNSLSLNTHITRFQNLPLYLAIRSVTHQISQLVMICPVLPTSANSNRNNNRSLQLHQRFMPKVATHIGTQHLFPLHPAGFSHQLTEKQATKILDTCVGRSRKKEPKQCLICFPNAQSRLESSAKYRDSALLDTIYIEFAHNEPTVVDKHCYRRNAASIDIQLALICVRV